MEHLNNIAEVIVKLDADIYNLNEVEDCQILQDLLSLLPAGHGYACYMVKGEDAATGQRSTGCRLI